MNSTYYENIYNDIIKINIENKENNDSNENKYVDNIGNIIDSNKVKETFRRHREEFFMNDKDIIMTNEIKTKESINQSNIGMNNIYNNTEKTKILVKRETPNLENIFDVFKSLIGLNNLGLTCYVNSSLQILIHNRNFIEKISTMKYNINKPITTAIQNLISCIFEKQNEYGLTLIIVI